MITFYTVTPFLNLQYIFNMNYKVMFHLHLVITTVLSSLKYWTLIFKYISIIFYYTFYINQSIIYFYHTTMLYKLLVQTLVQYCLLRERNVVT